MKFLLGGSAGLALAIALAIVTHRSSERPASSFRWLPGLVVSAATDERSDDAATQLGAINESPDLCSTFDAQELVADVAPMPGRETVLASVATGVVVLDAVGRRLAMAPLAECGGSADGIVALAVGNAGIGPPMIAVVFSSGGHRESETDLVLYRVEDGALRVLFTGTLETRDGDDLETGSAFLLPGMVVYRPPTGPLIFARLDR